MKFSFNGGPAPYCLGLLARQMGASVAVNPYSNMSDRDLKVSAPGMTWEQAAVAFEQGWNLEQRELAEVGNGRSS